MAKRRKYSAEFVREAVALANQLGVTRAQIRRELDINPNIITRWQRELQANGSKTFLGLRRRSMAVSVRGRRSPLWHRRRLVDEPLPKPSDDATGRADGVAAARTTRSGDVA